MKTLVAVFSIVTALAAQGPDGTASLKGRVIDAVSGQPVSGIALRIGYQPRVPSSPGGNPPPPDRNAITAADGTFEIAALPAGDYAIHQTGFHLNPGARYLEIAYGVRRPGGASAHLTVAKGATLDVTIHAWPAASISGQVVDERGRPVAGADVWLLSRDTSSSGFTRTDTRGAYRIGGLLPGRYATVVPVAIENRPTKAGLRAWLSAIVWPARFPYLLDRDGRTVLYTHYLAPPPPAGDGRPNVFVSSYSGGASSAADAGYVLSTGEQRGDVGITLRARPGRRVAGVASVASGSVTGVIVTLKPAGLANADYGHLMATAAADGRFVFVAAPEGEYTLTARRRGPLEEITLSGEFPTDYSFGGTGDVGAQMPLRIGDRDIDGLAVHLARGTDVAGRVIFENASVAPTMWVTAHLQSVEDVFGNDRRDLKMTADHRFSGNVQPGRYFLHVNYKPGGWSFKGARVNGRDLDDGPIVVGSKAIGDLELVFSR